MKQANFDVAHELDEFLLAEKPLTHTKRKANPDLEKMKPELRQLEEQYVLANHRTYQSSPFIHSSLVSWFMTSAECHGCRTILSAELSTCNLAPRTRHLHSQRLEL
jgi:serine/threonine kinase 32